MKKTAIGVIISAVVLYLWGFLFWGFGPYARMIWQHTGDDAAAGQALLEHFPDNGTYFVPGLDADPSKMEALYASGPVAFVHMLAVDGRPMFDSSIMINGFFLNLVVILLIAVLMRQVRSALPTFVDCVKFSALAGLTAAILIDLGDSVWWQIDWPWMLYNALYHLVAWLIVGAILAKFIDSGSGQIADA